MVLLRFVEALYSRPKSLWLQFKSSCPWLFASTIALCSSDMPAQCRRIQPLASGGKLTFPLRWHWSKVSLTRPVHDFKSSPSLAARAKIAPKASFSGKRGSSSFQIFASRSAEDSLSKDKCSHASQAFPPRSSNIQGPLCSGFRSL